MEKIAFHKDMLVIQDPAKMLTQICDRIASDVHHRCARKGGVVGISGGIDSSLTLALAARALGPDKVLGVMLPEKDSSPDSEALASELARKFNVETCTEVITPALEGFGCYRKRDEAVSALFPSYDPTIHKMKIGVKQSKANSMLPPVFHLTLVHPDGDEEVKRLPSKEMRAIIAASNFKQRTRMSYLYYHAERLHHAVIGTPNRHEVDQGFFVKFGDGGSDLFPIGRLYKSQVYQLAAYLGVPDQIIQRTPTTDTYTAEQTQEEFFYQYPFPMLDLLWFAFEHQYEPEEVAPVMGLEVSDVQKAFVNFERRYHTTSYLRTPAINDYDFFEWGK